MDPRTSRFRSSQPTWRGLVAIGCAFLLMPGEFVVMAQDKPPAPKASPAPAAATGAAAEPDEPKLTADQLQSLVAPIALYPDPLLAQTLVASTYPLEIIQLQQWMAKNPTLKDKALADAVAKQPWDPAIQSMAAVPEVVKRLADDVQWTTDLGNAFLAQQSDVMNAVQVMRKKAEEKGALKSNEQQKVETKTVDEKTVIIVQPTNPEVIYVPSYSPTVVYGPPVYPYPPIYYPPYPPGAAFVSFSFGVMMGAAFWGGSCCGCGWGHSSNVNINVNNNFNRVNHNNVNRGNNNWNHNPQHRGAAPYGNKATQNKYGGSGGGRGPSAGQQPAGGNRGGGPSAGQQPAGGNRGGGPSAGQQPAGGNRGGGGPSAGQQPAGGGRGGGGGGADRIGSQNIPKSSGSKSGGFGGGSGGYSGSSARSSSSRGHSSMGGSRGGGSRGGGGGRRR